MKQVTLDVISDTHVDSWVGINHPEFTQELLLHKLIGKILPENPSDIIIIAGDIGHYNSQNMLFFSILKQYYKKILWVHGNHELYLISNKMKKQYEYNSFNRLNEFIKLSNEEENVHYLDGTTLDIDGVTIGGTGMWYNNDYAKKYWAKKVWTFRSNDSVFEAKWGESDELCLKMYNMYMQDSKLILHNEKLPMNYLTYFEEQKALMKSVYQKCDVIVSHVGPDWSAIMDKWKIPPTTFFYFDGKEFLNTLTKKDVIWIYGHTHDVAYFKHPSGCFMVCNPLDYSFSVPNWYHNTMHRKITTINVGKQPDYEDVFK